jgi:hypothetical protein
MLAFEIDDEISNKNSMKHAKALQSKLFDYSLRIRFDGQEALRRIENNGGLNEMDMHSVLFQGHTPNAYKSMLR